MGFVVVRGPRAGTTVRLKPAGTTIGRSAKADVHLDAHTLSRLHVLIKQDEGVWTLFDLKSRNGVFRDKARLKKLEIKSGDYVQLGNDVLLRFGPYEAGQVGPPSGDGDPGDPAAAEIAAYLPKN